MTGLPVEAVRRSIGRTPGRTPPRLGIDIGRVIIDGPARRDRVDTAFFTGDEAAMLGTPEVPGAVDSIARLVVRLTAAGGQVWLVSKCSPPTQARTRRWLAAHRFHERTDVPIGHVRFCLARSDKRLHSAELGLTHFVDDHPEVHEALHGLVPQLYFFGSQPDGVPSYGTAAPDWPTAERLILRSVDGEREWSR